jgi:hypothetical protein
MGRYQEELDLQKGYINKVKICTKAMDNKLIQDITAAFNGASLEINEIVNNINKIEADSKWEYLKDLSIWLKNLNL